MYSRFLKKKLTLRAAAESLTIETGRKLSHVGLSKIVQKE
jgi:hypothetical protein